MKGLQDKCRADSVGDTRFHNSGRLQRPANNVDTYRQGEVTIEADAPGSSLYELAGPSRYFGMNTCKRTLFGNRANSGIIVFDLRHRSIPVDRFIRTGGPSPPIKPELYIHLGYVSEVARSFQKRS